MFNARENVKLMYNLYGVTNSNISLFNVMFNASENVKLMCNLYGVTNSNISV